MTKRKLSMVGLTAVVTVWIVFKAVGYILPYPADELDARMQLGPYHEGMSLREVFESFPEYGAGEAELRLLRDNNLAWAARWDLLDKARHSIDLSYFILKEDLFGVTFLSHLLKKAEEGVKVRILLDAFGSRLSWDPQGNDYLDALVNTGNVEVRMYRPLVDRVAQGVAQMSLAVAVASEHDKILVVDGERAITGGRNIAIEYFAHPDDFAEPFRDMEVEIVGRHCAAALIKAFEVQFDSDSAVPVGGERVNIESQDRNLGRAYEAMNGWLHGHTLANKLTTSLPGSLTNELTRMSHLKGRLEKTLPPYLRAETRVLDSTTRFKAPNDTISRAATRLVKTARKEIFIQNPYIVVPDEAVNLFATASWRGVPVIVFTNSPASADSITSQAFFLEQWPYLLARIPSMRLYANAEKQMIHAKLATFDNTLSLVGTYNLSPLSMATNSEVVVAVWSPAFAARLTEKARARLASGPPDVYRYRIVRNADGKVQRGEDGRPIAAIGPKDHIDLKDMSALQAASKALKAAEALPGVSPFF